jgi:hypothetical protein
MPSAIFAGNNFIAFGAIQRLREAGLEIPDDMSIVCFDDLPQGWIQPFLTTVSQPTYEIGKQAAHMLLERLATDEPLESRVIVLPSSLIVRRSSAPPRSTKAQTASALVNPGRTTEPRTAKSIADPAGAHGNPNGVHPSPGVPANLRPRPTGSTLTKAGPMAGTGSPKLP